MDDVITQLIRRIQVMPPTDCQSNLTCSPPLPVDNATLMDFERESGLVLPIFLRRLYTEVANGGFGPAWGINPLTGDDTMSLAYWDRIVLAASQDENEPDGWPTHLIRLCEIGCNQYYGVDIRAHEAPVFSVDPTCGSDNPDDWLTPVDRSVERWLAEWAAKEPPPYKKPNIT